VLGENLNNGPMKPQETRHKWYPSLKSPQNPARYTTGGARFLHNHLIIQRINDLSFSSRHLQRGGRGQYPSSLRRYPLRWSSAGGVNCPPARVRGVGCDKDEPKTSSFLDADRQVLISTKSPLWEEELMGLGSRVGSVPVKDNDRVMRS
jgi:hypothetical protein